MAKYSFEFKKEVVDAYYRGDGGYSFLADKFGLSSTTQIRRWIDAYELFGDDGLKRSRKNQVYTYEQKLSVVELYLTSELSYREVALKVGIANLSMIVRWVKRYLESGPDGLKPQKKGRPKSMAKRKNNSTSQPSNSASDASADRIKELEEQLYWLRLENAFLKESRRLRLEEEAKMRERRESSTASEDPSN